ncbi:hypothetical protein J3E72DRAFT_374460 [Bipolaris maydis]|nr:hypothetical protein BM1_08190 [Bipolaris maydis]KAJ5021404.1 hypothetical protein J3E73DRAFT_262094 [Bipolaris maydis]KAJ5061324.1 hypothetical protein J3E74DRAFT_406185 [Bipolaris maydis]KAJ6198453.1 hypothetical protein J3E72DRAFT_374460 [Bipolaris maydis]KAJ6210594.1 hypothetical protein PSV09DRAFT_2399344 [Bipolaris maydis]
MRFSLAYLIGTAALSSAAPILEQGLDAPSVDILPSHVTSSRPDSHVSKRAIAEILAGSVASAAGEQLTLALAGIVKKMLPLTEWDPAREAFTQEATMSLWNNNPDPAKWAAAVCYNQAWDVSNKAGISDVVSLKFSLGALNTDYDCMYIGKGTQFYTQGDGGFINLRYQYDDKTCKYDALTGDLSC